MAMGILHAKGERQLHFFDSFQGLPNPVASEYESWMLDSWGISKEDANGSLVGTNALVATQQQVEEAVIKIGGYPEKLIKFHVGWFQDTVPPASKEIGPIALLRLDGDLYESTMVCLRDLYPLVVDGGFVIIDDYGLSGCRRAIEDYFKEVNINPYLHYVDAIGRYFIKKA